VRDDDNNNGDVGGGNDDDDDDDDDDDRDITMQNVAGQGDFEHYQVPFSY